MRRRTLHGAAAGGGGLRVLDRSGPGGGGFGVERPSADETALGLLGWIGRPLSHYWKLRFHVGSREAVVVGSRRGNAQTFYFRCCGVCTFTQSTRYTLLNMYALNMYALNMYALNMYALNMYALNMYAHR